MFINAFDLLVILTAGIITAALVLAVVFFTDRFLKPKAASFKRYEESPWMRFTGAACVSASSTALQIVQAPTPRSLDWTQVRNALKMRFADLPRTLPKPTDDSAQESYPSRFPDDSGILHIEAEGSSLVITITDEAPLSPVDKHRELLHRSNVELRDDAINKLAHPMWATKNDELFWTNKAFRTLQNTQKSEDSDALNVFKFNSLRALGGQSQRASIALGPSQSEVHWYDISSVEVSEDILLHCAVNVDGLIAAETAQRKFVQTLAKHLPSSPQASPSLIATGGWCCSIPRSLT